MEVQMARLEGAYLQIADRLNGIDHRIEGFEQRVDSRFAQVDARLGQIEKKIDGSMKTMISWILGQTVAIIGSIAAVAFALHR
jgi:tetrahydromethanopterin S-methyltransferase subunit G